MYYTLRVAIRPADRINETLGAGTAFVCTDIDRLDQALEWYRGVSGRGLPPADYWQKRLPGEAVWCLAYVPDPESREPTETVQIQFGSRWVDGTVFDRIDSVQPAGEKWFLLFGTLDLPEPDVADSDASAPA